MFNPQNFLLTDVAEKNIVVEIYHYPKSHHFLLVPSMFKDKKKNLLKKKNTASDEDEFGAKFG